MTRAADVRVLTALLCPSARLDLRGRLEREFYRRGWPKLKYANDAWKDERRGQPSPIGSPRRLRFFESKGLIS